VEEMVQEVYCRLLERRQGAAALRDRPAAQLWTYLQRIARSVVVDQLRTRAARKRGGGLPPDEGSDAVALGRAPGPSPEERLCARERAAQLRRRVRELGGAAHGARNLRILELAAVEGCTAVEISRRIAGGLSPSSVHTVLHRLRRQLTAPGESVAALAEV
jgi:RNA polymerase sigma factor (sigma-70 family)